MSILTDKEVMMDNSDYFGEVNRALINLFGIDMHKLPLDERASASDVIDNVLGVKMTRAYHTRPGAHDRPMPDEWRDFFVKLAGPHGKTILKAYQAKRGILK